MVDLPAPLGPTSPTLSPRNTAIDVSRNRMRPPCCLETDSRRITTTHPRAGCEASMGVEEPRLVACPRCPRPHQSHARWRPATAPPARGRDDCPTVTASLSTTGHRRTQLVLFLTLAALLLRG